MKLILALPLIIPLATAALCLLSWRRRSVQRWLGVAGSFALLGAGAALLWEVSRHGITAVQAGGWPAPFGITLEPTCFRR
jgi:multicomponent Na+:H+ antiporter subunit D